MSNLGQYINNYQHKDFYYEDDNSFYDEVVGVNDYPPDLVDVVGYGLAELDMFDELGSTRKSSGYERLVQSMRNILSTPLGTRFFLPSFGSRIHELIFEQNDFIFSELLEVYTRDALSRWEPRVVIDDIIIDTMTNRKIGYMEILFHAKMGGSNESFVYQVNRELQELD